MASDDSGNTGNNGSQSTEGRERRAPATYVVKSGDTLISIAHENGVPVARIEALNPEVDPQILIAGEKLKLRKCAAGSSGPWRRASLVAIAAGAVSARRAARSRAAKGPPVDARAWVLIDARTGDVLASHAASRRLPIASTTKLMTAYVAMHELPLDRIVRAAPYQAEYGESLLGLRPGQRISVRDLLYGLILRSGNDAAYDLALAAAGSESASSPR